MGILILRSIKKMNQFEKFFYKKITFNKDLSKNENLLLNEIHDQKILIIGGAGTIGSSYIKQILKFKPSKITVVDNNENGLTELTRDLRSSDVLDYNPEYITYPVNLLSDTFNKIFNSDNWDVVANFSAHKHVRSEKDKISVEALIKNNVFGAIKLLNLCEINPPRYFFSVSTDKAANPVNIMGASKSLMEKLILSKKDKFRVSTARFANVAFSNGSLLDGFIYRIQKQQPLSCPSDIKRFFVTPTQSGQICLLATFLGETGNIFFPKLDFHKDQIYFKEIALDFLKENGFEPVLVQSEQEAKEFNFDNNPKKYPIYFFKTDTSGEKTCEEFYTKEEDYEINEFDSLGYINTSEVAISFDEVEADFESVFSNPNSNKLDIVRVINKYVPDFMHIETGKHLDQKM
jgi:FlaA1/EpsC-like NDP-sugar epimerase